MLEISDSFEVLGLDRGRLTWKPGWIPEVTSRPMENAENDHVTDFGRKNFIHIVNKWRTFSMSTSSIWTQQRTRKNLRGVRKIFGIMKWKRNRDTNMHEGDVVEVIGIRECFHVVWYPHETYSVSDEWRSFRNCIVTRQLERILKCTVTVWRDREPCLNISVDFNFFSRFLSELPTSLEIQWFNDHTEWHMKIKI